MTDQARRDEIEANLAAILDRIASAAAAAGRHPGSITLVVVTKTFPVEDIRLLADLGVRDIGENRHPEAADKATALSDIDLRWHFVGQVQSNKAARIASYADVVHSIDSSRVVRRLGMGAEADGRLVTCLVQVSLDPQSRGGSPGAESVGPGRGGAAPDHAAEVADAVASTPGLRLGGVMGVAPQGEPPARAFARLGEVARQIRGRHPSATMMSAGMSGDFPDAIEAGATHVRVGSAVLGSRPRLR